MQVTGEVTAINGNDATIAFNSISFRTDIRKLAKISKKEAREVRRGSVVRFDQGSLADAMNKRLAAFESTLDVRGMRVDELLPVLSDYLDEATLLSIRYVRILHGKGNGILRQVVRQQLTRRSDVETFEDEILEMGGSGITVVKMSEGR
ncbi:MAG: Smr/MutS family protein, partial [Bacteroidales bacterium]|nr:Smr/MutS family protein [Bacteroidales bacterium]